MDKVRLGVVGFNAWVKKMNEEYEFCAGISKMYQNDTNTFHCSKNGYVVIFHDRYTTITNYRGKIGVAKCSTYDTFVSKIGIAIAWARLNGYEVPEVMTSVDVDNLENGDRITVVDVLLKRDYIYIGKDPTRHGYFILMDKAGKLINVEITKRHTIYKR